jgi:hypothetical protein
MSDSIVNALILKYKIRAAAGKKKYGVDMDREDLTEIEWLHHAQQEAMDFAIYLEKLIQEKE